MLDFGWAELFLIMAIGILVMGPKEIPALMRGLGNLVRRFQYMKYSITRQFEEFMDTGDIDELSRGVNFGKKPEGHEDFDEAAEDDDEDIVPESMKEPANE